MHTWPLSLSSRNAISPALMIGLLLAGSVYWACTVLVLHFHAFGEEMAAAASLPNIVVHLFGVQALWIACVIGYLACFASLNIYIQVLLAWSGRRRSTNPRLSGPAVAATDSAQRAERGARLLRH